MKDYLTEWEQQQRRESVERREGLVNENKKAEIVYMLGVDSLVWWGAV